MVLFLGAHHFDPEGSDVYNLEVGDVLSEKRQSEIKELVSALTAFSPTKIAVELQYEDQDAFNELYLAYRSGNHTLNRNERQQLAMRLAAKLDHDQLYGVDALAGFDASKLPAAAAEAGETERLNDLLGEQAAALTEEVQDIENDPNKSILDLFRYINSDWHLRNQQLYSRLASIGSESMPAGAELTAQWEARNIKIAANIDGLIDGPSERILVIFGAGHRASVERVLREMNYADLADPLDYLILTED